ncbi:MAG: DUF6445 family protein [Parasphingorhabdus sp.]|uniref:DUF6445 family protein n=1 Tax=Parasphingorhabdus sp. TaxID=2709688 RepID=UPI003001FF71
MLPSLLIIDDFLCDPMLARKAALALDYDPNYKQGNYPGHISTTALYIQGLDERVSKAINAPVKAATGTSHCHCRITLKGDKGRSGVHIDPAFYSGILYLSLPEHCKGGTEFFRHKRTELERVPSDPRGITSAGYADINDLIDDVVNRDTLHKAKWERTMLVPMRFNRLILFSPWLFHNSGAAFGNSPETGRLVHLMFFAKADR